MVIWLSRTMRTHDDSVPPLSSAARLICANSSGVTRTSIRALRFMAPPWEADRADFGAHRRNIAGLVVEAAEQPIVRRHKSIERHPVVGIVSRSHGNDDLCQSACQPHPIRQASPKRKAARPHKPQCSFGIIPGFQWARARLRAGTAGRYPFVKMGKPPVRLIPSQTSEKLSQASHDSPSKVYAMLPDVSSDKSRFFSETSYGR